MDLKINIKNLGKLTDASIRINKFTVFAGVNDTGKSFASKALYSRLSANMNDVNVLEMIDDHGDELRECIDNLKGEEFEDDLDLDLLLAHLDKFDTIVSEIKSASQRDKIPMFEKHLLGIFDTCQSIGSKGASMLDKIEEHNSVQEVEEEEEREFSFSTFKESLDVFGGVTKEKIRKIFTTNIENMFEYNYLRNFQAKKLSELANDKSEKISVKIDAKLLMLKQEEYVKDYLNNENYSNLDILHTFIAGRVLFLGSPLFWQLKNSLELAESPMFFRVRRRLSGTPKYFYDMVDTLKAEYMGDPVFPDVLKRLTGEEVMNGKVTVAPTGEMVYAGNNGVTVPLVQAATGIANLGMLALLIEKNMIEKNTFLFIDEPEAHLHPAWQVEMAEALFNLAKAGVHVVIATHSAEILKWLEVHVKENPEAKEMIALNHFHKDGNVEINGGDFDKRIGDIQKELAMPYYKLFYRGMR